MDARTTDRPGRRRGQAEELLPRLQGVAALLDDALQAARKARPGEPERELRLTEAVAALVGLILDRGELVMRFTDGWPLFEMRQGAYPVPNPVLTEVGRRAWREGLRAIRLRADLDPAEGGRLLELMAAIPAGPRPGGGGDLVTRLWEADLRSVGLEAASVALPPPGAAPGEPGAAFPALADEEVRREIRAPLLQRCGLYLIQALAEEPSRRELVAPVFAAVVSGLVSQGDLAGAADLFREADKRRRLREADLRALQGALDPYRRISWLEGAVAILESLGRPAAVADFLARLGPGAVPTLVQGLRRTDAADTLFDVLVELARRDLRPFRDLLQTNDTRLLADLLRILAEVGDAAASALARPHLESPEPQLRCLALRTVAAGPPAEARGPLRTALQDRAGTVRTTALRLLGGLGERSDLDLLQSMVQERSLFRRDAQEKLALLEALAVVGGDEALALLEPLALGLRRVPGDPSEETQACAVRALALVPGERARQILIQVSRQASPALKQAALAALHGRRQTRSESPSV